MSDQLVANLQASARSDALRASLRSKDPRAFTLILDGMEVPVLSGKVSRTIDTIGNGWTAEIAWIPGADKELDRRVNPYTYTPAQVYLGSTLVNTGRFYTLTNRTSLSGITKTLEGASYTADMVDSDIDPNVGMSGMLQGLSVWNIMNALCNPIGQGVKTDLNDVVVKSPNVPGGSVRVTDPFPWIDVGMTEKYAELFTRLAFQRGMLVTDDEYGNLLLTNAHTQGTPVATITDGDVSAALAAQAAAQVKSPQMEAKYDGRQRWYRYTVYSFSGSGDFPAADSFDSIIPILSESNDVSIPKTRRMHVIAGDVNIGGAQITAAWKRSMQYVKSLTIPFPVTRWYDANGKLWKPNTLIRVQAPILHIPNPYTLLIRQVEYELSASGQTATLHLIPPQVYTGEPIQEPWAVAK